VLLDNYVRASTSNAYFLFNSGGGVIADLFPPERRGLASSVYSTGPLFGPIVGPVCGGFIAQRAGWRWVFWILLIAGTVVTIGIEIFNSETNPRVIIKKKVQRE
jgi:MFS family permease